VLFRSLYKLIRRIVWASNEGELINWNGEIIKWGPKDTFTAPVFAEMTHKADEESFLIRIHDRPLQDKLGYYEERSR